MIQLTPEERSSKLPALALLCGMGYRYLSPEQADGLRGAAGGKSASVVLAPVLRRYLGERSFQVGETSFFLSPANVEKIIAALRPPPCVTACCPPTNISTTCCATASRSRRR